MRSFKQGDEIYVRTSTGDIIFGIIDLVVPDDYFCFRSKDNPQDESKHFHYEVNSLKDVYGENSEIIGFEESLRMVQLKE